MEILKDRHDMRSGKRKRSLRASDKHNEDGHIYAMAKLPDAPGEEAVYDHSY
jgi:hypothetical protein